MCCDRHLEIPGVSSKVDCQQAHKITVRKSIINSAILHFLRVVNRVIHWSLLRDISGCSCLHMGFIGSFGVYVQVDLYDLVIFDCFWPSDWRGNRDEF